MKTWAAAATLALASAAHAQAPAGEFDWGNLIGPALSAVGEASMVGYYTGEKLYRTGRDSAVGLGYVMAVYDATWPTSTLFCVPDAVSSGQLRDVVWKYLEQHPETRHSSAAFLVKQSLAAAWPCPAR